MSRCQTYSVVSVNLCKRLVFLDGVEFLSFKTNSFCRIFPRKSSKVLPNLHRINLGPSIPKKSHTDCRSIKPYLIHQKFEWAKK